VGFETDLGVATTHVIDSTNSTSASNGTILDSEPRISHAERPRPGRLDGSCQNDSINPIMTDQLLQQLKKFRGKWVALFSSNGEMKIVASGEDAVEANKQAAKNGYQETTLFKVLPSEVAYVPLA
jgi:hypothetical protein